MRICADTKRQRGGSCIPTPWGCADYCAARLVSWERAEAWERWHEFTLSLIAKEVTPRTIFLGRMLDPFHDAVEDAQLDRLFFFMAHCSYHTFILLTDNPGRMRKYMNRYNLHNGLLDEYVEIGGDKEWWKLNAHKWLLSNVSAGVIIDSRGQEFRILELMDTPFARHFIFFEPSVREIDLTSLHEGEVDPKAIRRDVLRGHRVCDGEIESTFPALDWVSVGKKMIVELEDEQHSFIENLRTQCDKARVPFFVNSWACTGQRQLFEVSDVL